MLAYQEEEADVVAYRRSPLLAETVANTSNLAGVRARFLISNLG